MTTLNDITVRALAMKRPTGYGYIRPSAQWTRRRRHIPVLQILCPVRPVARNYDVWVQQGIRKNG